MSTKEVRTKFTTLFIDPIVMKKIMYYAQAADGEVSGLGTVIKDDKGRHTVNEVYLLEQECSGADTELKPEAISKLMTDMLKENKDPGQLKFWWHSHVNMGVFWSGTDDACAETLSKEFAFSLVVNKRGEKQCRLDLYSPFRVTFDGVKVEEIQQEDNALKEQCEKEVKEKVKSPHERWNGWNKDDDYDYSKNYFGRGKYGNHVNSYHANSNVKLPASTVSDIEDLLKIADSNDAIGGVFCMETWTEFIHDVLKNVAEKRFEKRAECNSFGTYQENYESCKGKCKVKKQCAFWTKVFEETEADAQDELKDYTSDIPEIIVG